MSDDNSTRMTQYLTEHPRMMGALFTLAVLLTQASAVTAECGASCTGP